MVIHLGLIGNLVVNQLWSKQESTWVGMGMSLSLTEVTLVGSPKGETAWPCLGLAMKSLGRTRM